MTILTNAPQGANASDLSLDPIVWASNHPDAELLAAWEAYCGHYRTIDALPESDAVRAPHMEALAVEHDRVEKLPAHTPAGALVKAKLAFIGYEEAGAADAVIYGKPFPADVLTDCRERIMVGLIGDLERMVGVSDAHTLASGPAKGVASTDTLGHPDAGLLAAFETWRQASIVAESLPADMTEEDRKPYWDRVFQTRDTAMDEFQPQTIAGIVAHLKLCLAVLAEEYGPVLYGTPLQNRGETGKVFWQAIGILQGMVPPAQDCDAALLTAFRTYQSFMRDEDADADSRPAEAARKVMDSTPARTLAGVLALLGHYLGDGDLGVEEMPALDALKATIALMPPEVRDVVEVVVEKAEGLAGEHFQTLDSRREALAERDQLKASLAGFRGVQSLQMVMLTDALEQAWDAVDEAERQEFMAHRSGKVPEEQWAKERTAEAHRRVRALESAVIHLPGDTMGVAAVKLAVAGPAFCNVVERLEDLAREDRGWESDARDARECLSALRSAVPTLIRVLGIDLHEIGLRQYMWPDHCLDTGGGEAPISTAA